MAASMANAWMVYRILRYAATLRGVGHRADERYVPRGVYRRRERHPRRNGLDNGMSLMQLGGEILSKDVE
jgi:hypothetical protein